MHRLPRTLIDALTSEVFIKNQVTESKLTLVRFGEVAA